MNDHIDYVKQELEYNNLIKTDMGKQVLKLFETSWEFCDNNKLLVDTIITMVTRLNKKLPLLPLEEEDMVLYQPNKGPAHKRHKRYFPVFQSEDGKYYDEHGILFVNESGIELYCYSSEYNSRVEIEFPYYPIQKRININMDLTELDNV
jgi:hypothetical protein